jgi:hypothetical protein
VIHKHDFQTGAAHSDRGLLEIKQALTSADWEIAHQMLDEVHFLGAGREAGDRLCQFVLEGGQVTTMLTLVALGLLMGGRDMRNIWRKVAKLDQKQREAIGLKVRHKTSGRLKMPGYDALNDLLNLIDPQAYSEALTAWLQANSGLLPRSLALDGKSIGDGKCGMIITLCSHEDGRPVAMIPATGKKEDSEDSEARALLASPQVRLENAVITADPLHNKEDTLRVIIENGGDYLIGTKDNTSKRLKEAEAVLKEAPFLI